MVYKKPKDDDTMKRALSKIRKYFMNNYEILIAILVFILILITKFDFYKATILMLEFIVIIEIVKMISDFIKKAKLRLRFIIDVFIIFLIRDVIILSSHEDINHFNVLFLLLVISIFFVFRILTIKFSPGNVKVSEETANVILNQEKKQNKSKDNIK